VPSCSIVSPHPYTRSLLAAVPVVGGRRVLDSAGLEGDPPNPLSIPSGCRFHHRCPQAVDRCATTEPMLRRFPGDHQVACHLAD
jgi:oligopeptide/dipeptide ABC transporter ATP-binding protein